MGRVIPNVKVQISNKIQNPNDKGLQALPRVLGLVI
jgi:hypothetical protein